MHLEEFGLKAVIPHVKKIRKTDIWELRILGKDNIRVFYGILINKRIMILHGFIKKKQKTPTKEISIALSRWQEVNRI